MSRRRLHLVRTEGGVPDDALADRDWVVYLPQLELAPRGSPPLPAGRIDHDQLVQLIVAASIVITW